MTLNGGHDKYVVHIEVWNSYQSKCQCGWVGRLEQNRPDAIRHHTIHAAPLLQGYGA